MPGANPYRGRICDRQIHRCPQPYHPGSAPDWFVRFQNTLYFDPGNKEVQQYVTTILRDIVHNYDIDGLHLDDYFYPYDIVEGDPVKDFPDKASFGKYGQRPLSIGDWRKKAKCGFRYPADQQGRQGRKKILQVRHQPLLRLA